MFFQGHSFKCRICSRKTEIKVEKSDSNQNSGILCKSKFKLAESKHMYIKSKEKLIRDK